MRRRLCSFSQIDPKITPEKCRWHVISSRRRELRETGLIVRSAFKEEKKLELIEKNALIKKFYTWFGGELPPRDFYYLYKIHPSN